MSKLIMAWAYTALSLKSDVSTNVDYVVCVKLSKNMAVPNIMIKPNQKYDTITYISSFKAFCSKALFS